MPRTTSVTPGTSALGADGRLYLVLEVEGDEAAVIRRGVPDVVCTRIPLGELTPLSEDEAVRWALAHRLVEGPRLVCAWCQTELRAGSEPASHGICQTCLKLTDVEGQCLT